MAFKNERISEQDREWASKLVNYESIRAISRWVHKFDPPDWVWTADHDRNAFLISLGGGGTPDDIDRLPYAVLILDRQLVVFNVVRHWSGDIDAGIDAVYEIHHLVIPAVLEHRRDEVIQLLHEAFDEYSRFMPTADGGTWANPNLAARWNIKSINIKFK